VTGAGIDADEFGAVAHLDLFEDADVLAPAPLLLHANPIKGPHVGQRAAIEDRDFEVIHLYNDVVDAAANQSREQMLGRRDEHTAAHQAGGVADLGDVAADGGNLEVVEVRAAED